MFTKIYCHVYALFSKVINYHVTTTRFYFIFRAVFFLVQFSGYYFQLSIYSVKCSVFIVTRIHLKISEQMSKCFLVQLHIGQDW